MPRSVSIQRLQRIRIQAIAIALTGNELDGDELTYSVAAAPLNGTVTISGNQASYQPDAGFVGEDSFTYTASDGQLTSEES